MPPDSAVTVTVVCVCPSGIVAAAGAVAIDGSPEANVTTWPPVPAGVVICTVTLVVSPASMTTDAGIVMSSDEPISSTTEAGPEVLAETSVALAVSVSVAPGCADEGMITEKCVVALLDGGDTWRLSDRVNAPVPVRSMRVTAWSSAAWAMRSTV